MLIRIFTIISLLIFLFLLATGSTMVPAMTKSVVVFVVLVFGTRISIYLLDIIRETSGNSNKKSSPSHR